MSKINICIVGVGNCASSLYQGIHYYTENKIEEGLMSEAIGGYNPKDINVVAAIDVDKRKVGFSLRQAIFSKPNCTPIFYHNIPRRISKSYRILCKHMFRSKCCFSKLYTDIYRF